jgi:hypothetical protein
MATQQFDADSNATLVESFSVLVNSIYNHANDLKDVSQLKTGSLDGGVDQAQLVELEQRIRVVEHTFKALQKHLAEEAEVIAGVKNLHSVVQEHADQIQKICSHLPEHLPQDDLFAPHQSSNITAAPAAPMRKVAAGGAPSKENVPNQVDVAVLATAAVASNATSSASSACNAGPRTGRKPSNPASKIKYADRIPRLRYLTVDEFSAVPTYTRGRLSLNKVRADRRRDLRASRLPPGSLPHCCFDA